MGNKVVQVGLIIAGVIVVILFITAIMPVFVDFTSTANTTIFTGFNSSNVSDYPGLQPALLAAPLWIYFIPVIVGVVAVVMVLREK